MKNENKGWVILVGAGCGSYDLITLRGKKAVENADVLVYDSLVDKRILDFAKETAEKICVGKRAGKPSFKQDNINKLLVEKACSGKNVVRLKGGDPFVFGRGGEEISALINNNICYSVVPGITSAVAVAESAGIPVTHRKISRSFHVITGKTLEESLPENMKIFAKLEGTLVFLMGLNSLEKITQSLIENGMSKDMPCAVVSNGGTYLQKTVRGTLYDISQKVIESKIQSPATIIVGKTVAFDFSDTLNLQLKGKTVTVTGTKNLTQKLSQKLENLGAGVNVLDYLKVFKLPEIYMLDNALKNINNYKYVVLTSINGAEIFFDQVIKNRIDIRNLSEIKFAVIGKGTAEILENHGIFADVVPEKFTTACLAEKLVKNINQGEKILIARAKKGSQVLNKTLDKNNILYDDLKIYDVLGQESEVEKLKVKTDYLTFASRSGAEEFFKIGGKFSKKTKIICIGEETAKALKEHNINNFYVCDVQDSDGVVNKILEVFENEKI